MGIVTGLFFAPEVIENTEKQIPAIILNNDFETLPDNRRPDGQPDYTQYVYKEGTVITAIKLIPGVKFELSKTSIIAEADIKVGGVLVPEAGSSMLMYSDNLEDINTKICLVVESFKDFRVGGLFGNETVETMVVRVKDNCAAESNGLKVSINTKVPDITSEGGKPPITYSLPEGMSNNDNFKISENTVLVKTEITQAGSYGLLVTGADGKGNVKNSITTAFTVASGK